MVSLRRFTSQQFADGTTIDGSRLEKALQDLEDWSEGISDGDFANRWMQSQLVLKYLPPTTDSDANLATLTAVAGNYRHAPFLPIYNNTTDENPHRLKGTRIAVQSGYTAPTLNYDPADPTPRTPDDIYKDQVVWTAAIAIGEDPIIIDSVNAVLLTYSSEYDGAWEYASGDPFGNIGEYTKEIQLEITADNPFLPNLQLKNTVVFHKYGSSAQGSLFTNQSVNLATIDDMEPRLNSVSGMSPVHEHSLSMNSNNLNIPLPPFTRLRFSFILPIDSASPLFGLAPWKKFIPTLSLNILERTVDG